MAIVKVGIIQMSCDADKTANNQKAIEKIREVAKQGAQIICLQELFSSLYFCDVESYDNFKLGDAIPGPTTETMQRNMPSARRKALLHTFGAGQKYGVWRYANRRFCF